MVASLNVPVGLLSSLALLKLSVSFLVLFTGPVTADDRASLLAMYVTWGSPTSLSWTTSTGPCDASNSWKGVLCTGNTVTRVDVNKQKLNNALNSAVGDLTGLTYLDLSNNNMTGPIPTTISSLGSLYFLSLGGNHFSGIPQQLSALTVLTLLNIGTNQASGTIPQQLSTLRNLQQLFLDHNLLTGSIPAQLSGMVSLNQLFLDDNALTATLPPVLSTMRKKMADSMFLVTNNTALCGPIDTFGSLWTSGTNLGNACPMPPPSPGPPPPSPSPSPPLPQPPPPPPQPPSPSPYPPVAPSSPPVVPPSPPFIAPSPPVVPPSPNSSPSNPPAPIATPSPPPPSLQQQCQPDDHRPYVIAIAVLSSIIGVIVIAAAVATLVYARNHLLSHQVLIASASETVVKGKQPNLRQRSVDVKNPLAIQNSEGHPV